MFPAAKLPGRLGHYRVRGRVRFDHSAEILVAREEGPLGFERDVTLRSVPRDPIATTWGELELAREARIAERLEHPSIVRVLELFTEGDRLVLAVEGAETVTLEELLARGAQLSDDACAYVLATIASALAYAHGRSVIHRAVDPTAVVIAVDGAVKLTAFGVSRMLDSTTDSAVTLLNARSRMASPEEATGAPPTAKTDVWSLGVLALQLFARGDAASAVQRAAAFRPPRMSSLRTDLPREVCAAVDAALQSAITCEEFAKWVDRVMDVDGGRRELAEHVELAFEATPELTSAPRLSRTIKRQAASRRRLRRAREPVEAIELVEEVEELEDLEPIEEIVRPLVREPSVIEPVQIFERLPAPAPALEPVVLVSTPRPRRPAVARPRVKKRSFAWVPSRLLLAASLAGALAVTAHRVRATPIAPASPLAQAPEVEEPVTGNACVESDLHCAMEPKPPPVIAPPARKLPEQFGWVHVHSSGTVGQVFVAARAWGEPEKTIAVPCGRLYVNVARADSKGNWRGWMNIGETVNIACDGTVTELTLKAMNASYEVKPARPTLVTSAARSSTWPMSTKP